MIFFSFLCMRLLSFKIPQLKMKVIWCVFLSLTVFCLLHFNVLKYPSLKRMKSNWILDYCLVSYDMQHAELYLIRPLKCDKLILQCHNLHLVILQTCTIKPLWYSPDIDCEPAQCTVCRRRNKNVTMTEENVALRLSFQITNLSCVAMWRTADP